MSCPDFTLSSRGRRGIGVIQPQSGLDYPFVAPPAGLKHLVADFFIAYDDPGEYGTGPKIVPPLRIKYLYNIGCEENTPPEGFPAVSNPSGADIVVVDAAGAVVFDSTQTSTERTVTPWGADYAVYSWKRNGQVCSLTAYTTWASTDDDKRNYPKYFELPNAVLDARATYKMPKRLRTLSVKNGTSVLAGIDGQVNFRNGYNLTLAAGQTTPNNFRVNTQVLFSAVAGTGLGKYQNCNTDETGPAVQPIKQINGIPAQNGDFLISSTDCLWARRPTVRNSGALNPSATVHQQIGADCPPCCECSDYVDTALYMNQVQSQYMLIGSRVNDVKLYHEQNVARWRDQRLCSVNPLKLLLVPQRCPYMDIVLMLCNPCQDCIPASKLTLTLTPTIYSPATLVCGYTAMYASGINGRPIPITETQTGAAPTANLDYMFTEFVADDIRLAITKNVLVTANSNMLFVNNENVGPVKTGMLVEGLYVQPDTFVDYVIADSGSGVPDRIFLTKPVSSFSAISTGSSSFSAQFPALRGGGSAYLKFRVKFEAKSQYVINGVLTAELNEDGSPILTGCEDTPAEDRDVAVAARSETLYCTPEGQTDKPC